VAVRVEAALQELVKQFGGAPGPQVEAEPARPAKESDTGD
jgi:hypothetical protein